MLFEIIFIFVRNFRVVLLFFVYCGMGYMLYKLNRNINIKNVDRLESIDIFICIMVKC